MDLQNYVKTNENKIIHSTINPIEANLRDDIFDSTSNIPMESNGFPILFSYRSFVAQNLEFAISSFSYCSDDFDLDVDSIIC